MKKTIKWLSVAAIASVLVALLSFDVFAEMVYEYYGLQYTIINNNSVSIYGRTDTSSNLVIPKEINGRTVEDIANRAFQGDENLTTLSFAGAKHLVRLGMFSFKDCVNLSGNLVLPAQITQLEAGAFQGCTSLNSAEIRAEVSEIPSQLFYQCNSLNSVKLNSNIHTIGGFAFANCTSLSYLELSKNITGIASNAFANDPNLTLGVWYGTVGYDYAIAQNIPYILLDKVLLGDVDGDGSVNVSDVTTIQRYLAELETLEGIYLHAADANQDGTVDISDATALQMYIAEYDLPYPIGEAITQ